MLSIAGANPIGGAAWHQPRHVGLVLRDYDHDARHQLAAKWPRFAAKKGAPLPLPVIVAWPYLWVPPFIVRLLCCTVPSCAAGPRSCDSAAVHNMAELLAAQQAGLAALYRSGFRHKSHQNATAFAMARPAIITRGATKRFARLCAGRHE